MIRIVVADDQALVREGLVNMLKLHDGLVVVGEARSGEEALQLVQEQRPDVLLLDYRMPQLDGLGVLEQLSASQVRPATLVLTTFEDDQLLVSSLRLGASGFLLKDVSLPMLIQAIQTVASGGRWLSSRAPTGNGRPESGPRSPEQPPEQSLDQLPAPVTLDAFTEREQNVLRLMTAGLSNREIAEALHTSEGTVKGYVSIILSKLGVRDRTRAVLKALNTQLI